MKRIGLIGMVVCACSFGGLKTSKVLTGTPSAPFIGNVKIVMEGTQPPTDVEEVAIVQAIGGGADYAKLDAVLPALRQEAASLGCDAVVHVRYEQGASFASASGTCVRTKR